ncbi:hypothetical protein H4R33_002049 [Dimargaris cristalligena]|nr:hypothetical protein H4R33_002049 [Dimargaris cristalligena]
MPLNTTTASSESLPHVSTQTSRKGKKSWRKNIDLVDVDSKLEEKRSDERVGAADVAVRSNDSLFAIDTAGNDQAGQYFKTRKTLTIDRILNERSHIRAVSNRIVAPEADLISNLLAKTQGKSSKYTNQLVARRTRGLALAKQNGPAATATAPKGRSRRLRSGLRKTAPGQYDIWGSESTSITTATSSTKKPVVIDFIEEAVVAKAPKAPFSIGQRSSAADAIIPAHPGASYRPTLADREALLVEAAEREKRRVANADSIADLEAKMTAVKQARKGSAAMTMEEDLDCMVQNRGTQGGEWSTTGEADEEDGNNDNVNDDANDDDEEEDDEDDEEDRPLTAMQLYKQKMLRINCKKSDAFRRRLKARRADRIKDAQARFRKEVTRSVTRAPKYVKQVEARLEAQAIKTLQMRHLAMKKRNQPLRRIGSRRVVDMPLVAGDAAPETESTVKQQKPAAAMRSFKPKVNLLADTYLNMQRLNTVMPRLPTKAKTTPPIWIAYERYSYKNFK